MFEGATSLRIVSGVWISISVCWRRGNKDLFTVPCNIAVTFKAVTLRDRFPYEASTTRSLSKTSLDEMSMVCSSYPFITAGSLMYLYVKDSKYYQGIHANMNITPHGIGKLASP